MERPDVAILDSLMNAYERVEAMELKVHEQFKPEYHESKVEIGRVIVKHLDRLMALYTQD